MKVVAFGASTSKQSINKRFVTYTVNHLAFDEANVLDLNDFNIPIFSIDEEQENGIPEQVIKFYEYLESADVVFISLAEHNGSYTAAFKNLFDWVSRHQLNMFEGTKLVLLSTAPGARGGLGVMEAALDRFPRHGADIIANFSLPKFHQNFSDESGIIDEALNSAYQTFLSEVRSALG